jgi:hypothetical protein
MRFNFYYNSNNENNDSKNSRVTQTSTSFRNNEYNEYLGKFQPRSNTVDISVNKQKICTTFNMGRRIFHDCEPYAFNATYPIRAVHFGGIIVFNNPYVSLSPTNFLGGSLGDLTVLSNLNSKPVNSIFVSTYQTIADHLTDNVGSVLSYASLEIVLVDANNIVVGWGTTSTSNVDDTTNGISGYEMTLSLFSFPEISNPSWVIGKGSSFSGLPSASQLPLFPFKELTI